MQKIRLTASRRHRCIAATCLLVVLTGSITTPSSLPAPAEPEPKAPSIRKAEPDAVVYKSILKGLGIEPVTFRCTVDGGPLTVIVESEEMVGSKRVGGQKFEGGLGQSKGEETISFVLVHPG